MPEHLRFLFEIVHQGLVNIPVAIGAGKNNNTKFHVIELNEPQR